MIKKKQLPKTFSVRIIICNMLIIFCIALFISTYNYYSYRDNVIRSETANSENRIQTLSSHLNVACNEMVNIIQNCSSRKSLFLFTSYNDYLPISKEQSALYASNVLNDFCAISGYSQYLYKITLYNKDNPLIQGGTSSGSLDDVDRITQSPWFSRLLHLESDFYRLSLVDNPFPTGRRVTPDLIPMVRPLNHYSSGIPEDAWVFLGISPKLFSEALKQLPGSCHVAIITEEGQLIAGQNLEEFPVDLIRPLVEMSSDSGKTAHSGSRRTDMNQKSCILTWETLPVSGLTVYEVLPIADMSLDHSIVNRTVILVFLFCILLGLILSLLFLHYLTLPIKRLSRHLDTVAAGNLDQNPDIESDDEIGWIGCQINQMLKQIQILMDNRIQSEQEKKNLEIKMLQAQINPHFLYNTLDSIKWIAKIQHNSGIVQVVTALSSLLKNMAKGFNEKVTIRQELDFLNDYVTIEKIRYIQLFDLEVTIEDAALEDASIVKLTLQPIVENAIFSGIEPSKNPGIIKIHIYAREQVLYLTITDNGVGIAPEDIEHLLHDTSRVGKSYMSGIGLPNVDRRLKLVYGEAYGLSIASEVGLYTTVTIALPLEFPAKLI